MGLYSERPRVSNKQYKFTSYCVWKMSRYGVFACPYFPVFGLNTGKYGPEKISYLEIFYAVLILSSRYDDYNCLEWIT